MASDHHGDGGERPLRVLAVAGGAAAAHAARYLRALGASVARVSAGPASDDSPYIAAASEVVDLPPGASLPDDLLAGADVVIRQCEGNEVDAGPLGLAGLRKRRPGLISAAITPFGESGPHQEHRTADLVSIQAGGLGYGTPPRVTDPDRENPLGIPGEVVQPLAGLVTVLGVLQALLERDADGLGRHVEVSQQEAVVSLMVNNIAAQVDTGAAPGRLASERPGARRPFLPARDGLLTMMAARPHHLRSWLELLGRVDLATRLDAGEAPRALMPEVEAASDAWAGERTRREVTALAQERHIPIEPVLDLGEILDCPQLLSRGFWSEGPGGLRLAGHPFGPAGADRERRLPGAARPGRSEAWAGFAAGSGPLAGVRVVDFTWVLAGPIATRILAGLGATVVKVEGPGAPPDSRGAFFQRSLHGGKRRTVLDLKDAGQRAAVEALALEADVVVENFATGVMERNGLGWERLRALNPALVMLSISGMGRTGPYAHHVLFGQLAQAYSGLTSMVGYEGGPPRGIEDGGFWSDPVTGYAGAAAVLAALRERSLTGLGRRIDISLVEATVATLFQPLLRTALGEPGGPRGNRHPSMAPHDTYRCAPADGDRWFALAVRSDEEWRALCRVIGREDLVGDPALASWAGRQARAAFLREAIEAWSRQRLPEEASRACQAVGIAAAPCRNAADLLADPHLAARGVFGPAGAAPTYLALPWRLHPMSGATYGEAFAPGEHTGTVLAWASGRGGAPT